MGRTAHSDSVQRLPACCRSSPQSNAKMAALQSARAPPLPASSSNPPQVGTTAFGVDFNTLERAAQQKEAEAGEATGAAEGTSERHVRTPADRLIWAVRTIFEFRGELLCHHRVLRRPPLAFASFLATPCITTHAPPPPPPPP